LEELAPFTKEGMFSTDASSDFHLFYVGRYAAADRGGYEGAPPFGAASARVATALRLDEPCRARVPLAQGERVERHPHGAPQALLGPFE
jgi:hypothetical protein